ncbi:hypothetical protein AO949_30540 [Pseudomonas aeruginosa]|nr:hypothetical protein AO949_30540 [Pseudomonas aeruginosa]
MGSCAAPSAKGDDKFITTDYLQQCPMCNVCFGVSPGYFFESRGSRHVRRRWTPNQWITEICPGTWQSDDQQARQLSCRNFFNARRSRGSSC